MMLCIVAGNRRKLLKFLSVQSVFDGICSKVSNSVRVETGEAGSFRCPVYFHYCFRCFTVSLSEDFDACKSVCVQAFARHTHNSKTPTNSF